MSNEIWSDIVGHEGFYKVSTKGRVLSLNYLRTGKEKLLVIGTSKRGYLQVNLSKNKKSKTYYVHRLVMNSFLGDYKIDVNHKDGDKTNNNISNLEYCTDEENRFHKEYVIPLLKTF